MFRINAWQSQSYDRVLFFCSPVLCFHFPYCPSICSLGWEYFLVVWLLVFTSVNIKQINKVILSATKWCYIHEDYLYIKLPVPRNIYSMHFVFKLGNFNQNPHRNTTDEVCRKLWLNAIRRLCWVHYELQSNRLRGHYVTGCGKWT